MKPDKKVIGKRIQAIRLQRGYSQTDFAKKIDATAQSGTVSNWEKGRNLPNKERLHRIAELGNTTVIELMYGSERERQNVTRGKFTAFSYTTLAQIIQAIRDNGSFDGLDNLDDFMDRLDEHEGLGVTLYTYQGTEIFNINQPMG